MQTPLEWNVTNVHLVIVTVTQRTITKTISLRLGVGAKEVATCSLATTVYPKQTVYRSVRSRHVRITYRIAYSSTYM
jgi:hypothetical protein